MHTNMVLQAFLMRCSVTVQTPLACAIYVYYDSLSKVNWGYCSSGQSELQNAVNKGEKLLHARNHQ